MGFDLNIYAKDASSELIPSIAKRFFHYGMDIEFHPEFRLEADDELGFVPIKMILKSGISNRYDQFGKPVLAGFEIISISKYDYSKELKDYQDMRKNDHPFIVDQHIDSKLKNCNQDIYIIIHTQTHSDLRVSLYFAAIIAELTNGIVYDPQEDRWLDGEQALTTFGSEILDYENSIKEEEFSLEEFVEW